MGRLRSTLSLAEGLTSGSQYDLSPASCGGDAKIVFQQPHERLVTIGAKRAAEAFGGQLSVGDHELPAVVAVELADDVSQWNGIKFEPALLPRERALHLDWGNSCHDCGGWHGVAGTCGHGYDCA